MSCKDYWEKEMAGWLGAASRVAPGQVNGAEKCSHAGCNLPINRATGKCPRGHVVQPAYPSEIEAVACALRDVEWTADTLPLLRCQAALAARQGDPGRWQRDGTPELAAANALFDAVAALVREGGYPPAAIRALATAYGHPSMSEADVGDAVALSELPQAVGLGAAVGPLRAVLEEVVGQGLGYWPRAEVQAQGEQALAAVYGDPELRPADVTSIARVACASTTATDRELVYARLGRDLLGLVPRTMEADPRVRVAAVRFAATGLPPVIGVGQDSEGWQIGIDTTRWTVTRSQSGAFSEEPLAAYLVSPRFHLPRGDLVAAGEPYLPGERGAVARALLAHVPESQWPVEVRRVLVEFLAADLTDAEIRARGEDLGYGGEFGLWSGGDDKDEAGMVRDYMQENNAPLDEAIHETVRTRQYREVAADEE